MAGYMATEAMSGPPVPPPYMPTLSAYPATGDSGPGPEKGGAVLRLFESVIKTLDTIALAAPQCADDIDDVKMALQDILVDIVNYGASDKPSTKSPGLMTPAREMESIG